LPKTDSKIKHEVVDRKRGPALHYKLMQTGGH